MIVTAPPPPPPVVTHPVAHEASYGVVRGRAAPGTRRVVVKVDGRVVGERRLGARSFVVDLDLPPGRRVVRVETVDGRGRRAATTIRDVLTLPRAARPRLAAARLDPVLQRDVLRFARSFGHASGIYVQDLRSGAGAAWNARATFPAASTLKLAIAVTALAHLDGPPRHGTPLDELFRAMLVHSDNAAANRVEMLIGGSTSGGSALVNAAMRAIGLEQTEMYGGYVIGTSLHLPREATARGIPLHVDDQPGWGRGKTTTAADLARLARGVWLASGGLGSLRRAIPGFSPREARYLLAVLARVQDPGKLDRRVGDRKHVVVLHKAGWVDDARHDNGLVVWRNGLFVATVMTYRAAGAGTSSDVLAGRVAETALARFRG